ncbi:hypothetical protein [Nonomuraea sp. NPDC050643]|uniref:hypothetical protein n=1 Tax=Nonomuraea sp. NPDC050643 TaxID=3155660 RepID=UPI00340D3B19
MRREVKFQDGTAFDGKAVCANFDRCTTSPGCSRARRSRPGGRTSSVGSRRTRAPSWARASTSRARRPTTTPPSSSCPGRRRRSSRPCR